MSRIVESLYRVNDIELKEDVQKIKYKNNIRLEANNGDVIRIFKREHKYVISGFDKNLDLLKPHVYNSFRGVQNYILKTYNIELM